MSRYQKLFRIMGLVCLVDSELPFTLVDSFDAFAVPAGEPDLIFELRAAETMDVSGYVCKQTYEGDICYHIYENEEAWMKLSYMPRPPYELRWCISRRFDDPKRYVYHIAENWRVYLHKFDPFVPLGLPNFFMEHSALLLHSSVVCTEGRGILFTAPSGTGKSTQADLWVKYHGAEIFNGDRGLIRQENGAYYVYGSPYAGSSYIYKDKRAPLRAIFVLRQAEHNRLRPMGMKEKFLCLVSQFLLFREDETVMNRQMDAIMKLMAQVPVYMLECRPDRDATDIVYEFLKEID